MERNHTSAYEYMSPEWIAAGRELITDLFADEDLSQVEVSFSEELTNPPTHLRRAGQETIGWCISIRRGPVEVLDQPKPDASVRVTADYEAFRDIQRFAFNGQPERIQESEAMRKMAAEQGKFKAEGGAANAPESIRKLLFAAHDKIAAITA